MRCLFTMFAEDVGLLGDTKDALRNLLETIKDPTHFVPVVEALWKAMDSGGFSNEMRTKLLRFNGGPFAEPRALALDL
jgi:hypothetical protein